MMDIMYFGYEWDKDSRQNEIDFINEIKEKFPNVKLKNAYDSIKGYRQEVWLDDNQEDDYMAFLLGKGWFEMSMSLQIDMMTKERNDQVKKWIDLTRIQYPESFKKPQKTEEN